MIIEGPVGVTPYWRVSGGSAPKEAAYIAVENGGTAAIAGQLVCQWDTTDNTAVTGILQDTLGLRITVASATAATVDAGSAGFTTKSIAGTAAGTRGLTYLLQVYGYMANANFDTTAAENATTVRGIVIPSTDSAGSVMGPTSGTMTTAELRRRCGTALSVVAVNTTTTAGIMVNCFH